MSICDFCGKDSQGGIYTSGDPYGDFKVLGLPSPPSGFWCWNCNDKVPDYTKELNKKFKEAGMCGFIEAYIGRCKNPIPCEKHSKQVCWYCKKPATRNCAATFTLVCGMPECDEHPHDHN